MRSCWLWKIPVGLVTGILAAVPAFSGEPVPSAAADAKRVRVPAGFQVSVFADDDLAGNIYSLTVDSLGRVVVAGPGYVRILVDRDGDGRAESFKTFSNRPASGAQGHCGGSVIVTGTIELMALPRGSWRFVPGGNMTPTPSAAAPTAGSTCSPATTPE